MKDPLHLKECFLLVQGATKNVFSNQQGHDVPADKADKLQNFMLFQNISDLRLRQAILLSTELRTTMEFQKDSATNMLVNGRQPTLVQR